MSCRSTTFAKPVFVLAVALCILPALQAQSVPRPADNASPSPDYAKSANWICSPASESVCTTGLDAKAVFPDGRVEAQPFTPADNPAIDCFYIYPTISREDRDFADLEKSPEIEEVVKSQAGRLSSHCRVYAPVYRQATLKHLRDQLAGIPTQASDIPYADVLAAWKYYLQHENHGRGVVLLGHSQGTILLQRLISAEIDGKAAQNLMVSAFLAGDPSLGVQPGKLLGGTFQKIPVCREPQQTGCVYAWGSYLEGQKPDTYAFGGPRNDGLESVCENPASPSGGKAPLRSFYPRPSTASKSDPPYLETVDQLSGGCQTLQGAHVFVVHVMEGPFSQRYASILQRAIRRPAWGLHPLDISLVQGNILETIDAETKVWTRAHSQ